MSPTIPGAIKRNVYLFNDDHTEKRDTQLPDVEWVNDEIAAEKAAREAADAVLQANIDAEEARAEAAEAALQTAITNEVTRATAAEATLQANIDAEETRAKAAETTLQANIDAEETRAETAEAALQTAITNEVTRAQAAEALKEDKANKVTSSATYVSDNTKYPTTAAVDARIAEISPTEVEYATQNVTTFAQIKQWLNAGKLVVAKCGDGENELYVTDIYDDSVFFCRVSGTYSERYIVDSNGWHLSSNSLEQTGNKLASTSTWESNNTKYPTTQAVADYVAAHAPSGVEWATYGTTTYSQIKSWNDAGKPVFLKYTVSGPVDYILKLTIVTPGGAFFCGIQGISEYTAEVNPANQWSYNNPGLQAAALVHEYETWDETDDTSYPSLASVSNYVASHAGGGVHVFTRGGTEVLADVQAAFDAGEVCVCYDETEDVYMQLISISDWQASFACVDSSHWEYNTNVWEDEWDDCWTNHLLLESKVNVSTETWQSSDNYIPSTKSVENYVASHSGCKVHVAEYGTTTLNTIKGWYDAGDEVICKYGDHLYHLGTCLSFRAVFAAVPNNNSNVSYLTSDNLIVTSSGWDTLQQTIETTNHRIDTYANWPVSSSYSYPTTTAVEGYVAAHGGSDVYDIAIPGEIPVTCDSCFFNDTYNTWEVKFNGSSTMYSPRINFKLLKNGNELQLDSNVKLVAEPYVSSGTKTYSSGEYFNAPSAPSWGAMTQDSYPAASSGKYFGIKILQSAASTSPNNSYIYIKYPGGNSYTGSGGLDPTKCYFVLSLYDKRVSETVPVARKVIQIVPTLMASKLEPGITWLSSTDSSLKTKIDAELTNGRFPGIVDSSSGTAKFFFYAGSSGLIRYFVRPYWKPTYETNYDWTCCYEKGQVSGAGTWSIDRSDEVTFYAYSNTLTHWSNIGGSGYKHQYDLTTLKVN